MNIGSRVELHGTSSEAYNGQIGTIVGVYAKFPEVSFWIVQFDTPPVEYMEGSCAVWISSCLKEIPA